LTDIRISPQITEVSHQPKRSNHLSYPATNRQLWRQIAVD
jgi:hypothetical protein